MPYKSEKVAINNPKLDKRVKLSDADRENIKSDYKSGDISIRGLERKYGVSRRLIQFILFPERAEKAKKDYAERRKDGRYYDKDKHTKAVREHRNYKNELYKNDLISENKEE